MYYIWGKNNNHLFKNNHKKTYSLPQKMHFPLNVSIKKISCGEDFVIILTKNGKAYFHYQSAFYIANDKIFNDNAIIDVATDDNIMIFITQKGQSFVSEFKHQKIINGDLKPAKINLKGVIIGKQIPKVAKVYMNFGQIFLKIQQQTNNNNQKNESIFNHLVYFKRNCWYQTKTFTDPKVIISPQGRKFVDLYLAQNFNIFLTDEGSIYTSTRNFPCDLEKIKLYSKISSGYHHNKHSTKKFTKVQVMNNSQWYGITQEGKMLTWTLNKQRQQISQMKQFCQISKKIIDMSLGNENGFFITQDGQGWTWGKNANGQLGLSDYEERKSIYPLITLENECICEIFIGFGYTCCLINSQKSKENCYRSENILTQKQISHISLINNKKYPNVKDKVQVFQQYLNNSIQKSSICPKMIKKKQNIQYSDVSEDFNQNSSFRMNSTQNLLFLKDLEKENNITKQHNLNKKNIIINRKEIQNQQYKSKIPKIQKQSQNYLGDVLAAKKSQRPQSNASLSVKKLQAKKLKTLFSNKKIKSYQNQNQKNSKQILTPIKCSQKKICCLNKSSIQKIHNDRKIDNKSCKSNKSNKSSFSSVVEKRKKYHKHSQDLITPKKDKENLISRLKPENQIDVSKYVKKIQNLMSQVHSLQLQNTDLKFLLKEKDLIIKDVTSKIMLLQQAIEQHQKTLTSRDKTMEENYLREKQYQTYIIELQNQLQDLAKDMKVQISAQKRQSLLYKKQIGKLSQQIKQRILQQKTFYKDKLFQLQRLYGNQKSFYEKQIFQLKKQLQQYKKLSQQRQKQLITRNQNIDYFQKYHQIKQNNYGDSPNFQTVQLRQKKQKSQKKYFDFIDEDYQNSKITLTKQHQILALNQKNFNIPKKIEKYDQTYQKNQFNSLRTATNDQNIGYKQNSQIKYRLDQQNEYLTNQIQVGNIIQNIQKNKNKISKSANKLLSILQRQTE